MKAKFVNPYIVVKPDDEVEGQKLALYPWVLSSPHGSFIYWTRIVDLIQHFPTTEFTPEDITALEVLASTSTDLSHLPDQGSAFDQFFSESYKPRRYQSKGIAYLLEKGNEILADDTGLGKSLIAMGAVMIREFKEPSDGTIVIVCTSGIRWQWRNEIMKMFRNPYSAKDPALDEDSISILEGTPQLRKALLKMPARKVFIMSYDLLLREEAGITDYLKRKGVSAFIFDECFPKGTLVDTPGGKVPIEEIRSGDHILNASGVDVVSRTSSKVIDKAIKVKIANDEIISSSNHPWFTRRGWVAAEDLRVGDELISGDEAVRLVRGDFSDPETGPSQQILREILLSEMEDERSEARGSVSHPLGKPQEKQEHYEVVGQTRSQCSARVGQESRGLVDEDSWDQREDFSDPAAGGAYASEQRRERTGDDQAPEDVLRPTWGRVGSGAGNRVQTYTGVSEELQGRSGESKAQDRDRGGWSQPPQSEVPGSEEGRQARLTRVEGLEILELGHPELDRFRDEEGALRFYDLTASRHPSFSVSGCLVHNSYRFKSPTSKTFATVTRLVKTFHPRQLFCLNATPIENSLEELWSQMFTVQPTIFPDFKEYDQNYVHRITVKLQSGLRTTKVVGAHRIPHLKALIKDRYVRRMCNDPEVEAELPEVLVSHRFVDLDDVQRKLYDKLKHEPTTNSLERVNALVRAALFAKDGDGTMHSAKLTELLDIVQELGDERCIFVTQSKVFAHEVTKLLKKHQKCECITGDVKDDERTRIVRDFTAGTIRYLVGTEAIERGLNLQAAGVMVHLDLPWNPASWLQRLGRIRRLGSKHRNIRAINLIANKTMEERVFRTVYEKHRLFENVFGDMDVAPVDLKALAEAV